MASFRTFTKRTLILLNIVVGMLFLLACCNAFLHPDKWWMLALLGLAFPLLLALMIAFLVFWLFTSRRRTIISVVCLAAGWTNIHAFFAFGGFSWNPDRNNAEALRIFTWNIRSWDDYINAAEHKPNHRREMMDYVAAQHADIYCFQEFYEPDEASRSIIAQVSQKLACPYHFFSNDIHSAGSRNTTGTVIFSKFPIQNVYQYRFDTLRGSESLIEADLDVNGRMLRVATVHLQSVLFKSKDFRDVRIVRNAEDSMLEASMSLAKKLGRAFGLRGAQADLVRRKLDESPYPVVLCGDFNDVPNSYTYFHIRGDRHDAFQEKGFGVGRSYIHISPTLRIDYIMPSKEIRVLQAARLKPPYSDHHPVVADLELPAGK